LEKVTTRPGAELLTPRLKFAPRMMAARLHPSVGICIQFLLLAISLGFSLKLIAEIIVTQAPVKIFWFVHSTYQRLGHINE
jgi:hypothetical protein